MLLAHTHSVYAWQADVDTTVVIPALSLLYLYVVGRFGAPRRQVVCFGAAMLLLAVAFWTPLHHLGLHYLLTAHLLQNVILAEWAPLFAVLGVSAQLAARLARLGAWRLLTHPAVALPLWLVNYFTWHVPSIYEAALGPHTWLVHLEHACYFGTGILMWWPLLQDAPRRLASGARAAYAFAAFLLASPLGLLLALLPKPVYDFYVDARPRVWGLSALADQQIAGVTMASEQAIVLFVVFFYWFRRFLAEEGAT
ncbi:MAG TPA: cytochrome c oxidase assembly protein [Gaiellaceae bacterium]|nr:cytochrome c oxidase assembly protein [Gaiellaceae bacterium]